MFRIKLRRCILPLLLIIALLFPAAAYAASPAGEFTGAAAVELNRNIPLFRPKTPPGEISSPAASWMPSAVRAR